MSVEFTSQNGNVCISHDHSLTSIVQVIWLSNGRIIFEISSVHPENDTYKLTNLTSSPSPQAIPIACYWVRSLASRTKLLSSVLRKSSLHLARRRSTLHLPRCCLLSRTRLPQRLSVLRLYL